MKDHVLTIIRSKLAYVPLFIFIILSVAWIYIRGLSLESSESIRQLWAAVYQIMALYGGIIGLIIAKKWGGYESVLGKSISMFALGLFFQSFGQSVYSYYIYVEKIEIPYPSLGDVGFFGSVICYIIAVYLLAKVSGLRLTVNSLKGKLVALCIPIGMLIVSYFFFLQGYEYDWTNKLQIFLDFGYPFGQAIYVSIAILALFMCRNILGGIMKKPILFFIFALILQYICDFMFLYQSSREIWIVGDLNDYMYFLSYFVMTSALIYISGIFNRIQES